MIKNWLALFSTPAKQQSQPSLDLACAVLLVEIITADYQLKPAELISLQQVLQALFHLNTTDAQTLMEQAQAHAEQANDLFKYTEVINQHWHSDDKFKLLQGLWRVAYSDFELDKYEELRIRKISDLLYIPHSEFIRAKLSVKPHDQ